MHSIAHSIHPDHQLPGCRQSDIDRAADGSSRPLPRIQDAVADLMGEHSHTRLNDQWHRAMAEVLADYAAELIGDAAKLERDGNGVDFSFIGQRVAVALLEKAREMQIATGVAGMGGAL